jgi:transposase
MLWHEPEGLCLYCKRLDRGHFVWPRVSNGTVLLTSAQLSMLLEGIDWRRPERTAPSEIDPKPPTLAA